MERTWIFRVPGLTQAEVAVRELNVLPTDVLIGMGIFCKAGPLWYVMANAENPTDQQAAQIEQILSRIGTKTKLTLRQLHTPKPIFIATGPLESILLCLETVDVDGYSPRLSRN